MSFYNLNNKTFNKFNSDKVQYYLLIIKLMQIKFVKLKVKNHGYQLHKVGD